MKQTATRVANKAASQAVGQWISQNGNTASALTTVANAPQALSPAFGFFVEDLSPIGSWAIAAPFEASLIYFVVLLYPLALWGYVGRQRTGNRPSSSWRLSILTDIDVPGFANKVTLPSFVLWRITLSSFCYFWLSLAYTTIFVAFQIPFRSAFGGGGFVVLWILNFLGLTALCAHFVRHIQDSDADQLTYSVAGRWKMACPF